MNSYKPTTMVDIYAAGGARINEDGESVSLKGPLEPFDIVLRVTPQAFEFGMDGEKVTFDVVLHDEAEVRGQMIGWVSHQASITLPVGQVRILKKEKDDNPDN